MTRAHRAPAGVLLLVNPGSAGPKRFSLPRTAGVLEISAGRGPRVRLWDLERDRPFLHEWLGQKRETGWTG